MKVGLFSAEGATYFADLDGVIQYGWHEIGDNKYYFDEETGAMKIGWTEIDGKMLFFDSNGKLTSVNSFNEKSDVTDAEIQTAVNEKEMEPYTTLNAPAADPMPLPDKLSDVAQSIQDAGAESLNSAAAVATPVTGTEITQDDIPGSDAVNGLKIDTTGLEVGADDPASERITFEGVK